MFSVPSVSIGVCGTAVNFVIDLVMVSSLTLFACFNEEHFDQFSCLQSEQ